jgi:hypothetical protein
MKKTPNYLLIIALLFLGSTKMFSQSDTTSVVNKTLLTEKWWSPDKQKNKNKNIFSQFFAEDGTYTVSKGPKGKWAQDGNNLKISQGMSKYTYRVIKLTETEFVFETMNTTVYFVKDVTMKKK